MAHAVDGNISDLFFNTDLSSAAKSDDKGQFVGWDEAAMRQEAETFLGCLARLSVAVPTIDDLLADFHKRV